MARKCSLDTWMFDQGEAALDYLKARTRRNVAFAAATAALHSGPVLYEATQPFVEEVSRSDPRKFLDPEKNERFLSKRARKYRFPKRGARALADTMKCYIDLCESDDQCVYGGENYNEFVNCLGKSHGVGIKGLDLAREYLGDPEAVAVDRHVMDWAVNKADIYDPKRWRRKGDSIAIPDYLGAQEATRLYAGDCGAETPADLQVGAWMSGVCETRNVVKVGAGASFSCQPYYTLERWT